MRLENQIADCPNHCALEPQRSGRGEREGERESGNRESSSRCQRCMDDERRERRRRPRARGMVLARASPGLRLYRVLQRERNHMFQYAAEMRLDALLERASRRTSAGF